MDWGEEAFDEAPEDRAGVVGVVTFTAGFLAKSVIGDWNNFRGRRTV